MDGGQRWAAKAQGKNGSASLAKNERLEFWKRGFEERNYSSLERARRGEEDGMVGGG